MRLLDKYIIKEWAKVFFLTLLVTVGVMVVERMYAEMPGFLEKGFSFRELVFFFLLYIPCFLPTVIPVALFISLIFVLGSLHRHNEIIAMRASGISLLRVARPLFFVGIILMGCVFLLIAYGAPIAGRVKNNYEHFLTEKYQVSSEQNKRDVLYNLGFRNGDANRVWFMNRFSEEEQKGYGVSVFLLDKEGNEENRILASQAIYDRKQGGWLMKEGREVALDGTTCQLGSVKCFEERYYPNLYEDPRYMIFLNKQSNDLNFSELKELITALPPAKNSQVIPYVVHYYRLLATPFSCFLLITFAVPFATKGIRVNPMVSLSKAAGLFFLYYLMASITQMTGTQGILPAWLAAWLPNLLILVVGIYLMYKWEVAH